MNLLRLWLIRPGEKAGWEEEDGEEVDKIRTSPKGKKEERKKERKKEKEEMYKNHAANVHALVSIYNLHTLLQYNMRVVTTIYK